MVLEKELRLEIKTNFSFKFNTMKTISSIIKLSIFSFGLLLSMHAIGQQLNMDVRDFNGNMQVFDPANPSKSKQTNLGYGEVEGTAFWSEQWNPAIVYFSNGSKAKINQAKLNLYTDEIHYLSGDGTELAVYNQDITRLVFLNKTNLTQPIASFTKLTNHITNKGTAYYRVLNAGNFQLILLQKQLVKTSPYDPMQGKSISSFYTTRQYAMYNNGKVNTLSDLNRNDVLASLPANSAVDIWLKENKNKLKSEKEVIAFLDYFNTLKPIE
jgi:hypothetical protein